MASRRHAVLGVFWSAVERAASQGISLLLVLVLARFLGPQNYGLVILAATIVLFGQSLLGETFSQALIQQKTLTTEQASRVFWVLLAAGAVSTGLVLAAAPLFAEFFGEPALTPLLRALSPLLLLASLQAVPTALFKRALDFRALAKATTTGAATGAVLGIGLALSGAGAWSLVGNLLCQNLLVTFALWRQSGFRPRWTASVEGEMRELWSYGRYTFLLRIAAFVANQSPRLLIGYFFGVTALGAFGLGLRIVEILYQLLTMPIVNVMASMVPKVRDEPERLAAAVLTATQLAAMISTPVFVALALMAPALVPVLFGRHWHESIPIIQIMCVFGLIGSCGLVWGAVVAGLGRPDLSLSMTTAAAVVNVTLIVLAAPFGLVASSLAFVGRGYLTLPLQPLIIARLTNIPATRQFKAFVPVILAALSMAIAVTIALLLLQEVLPAPELLVAAVATALVSYGMALLFWARPALRLGWSFVTTLRSRKDALA